MFQRPRTSPASVVSQAIVTLALALAPGGLCAATTRGPGIVVETVASDFGGSQAGVQAGDVLLDWRRPTTAAAGTLYLPFVLSAVELEERPRGVVIVSGLRGGQPVSFTMPHREWRITTRPMWTGVFAELYEQGRALRASDSEAGLAKWSALAEACAEQGDPLGAAWLWQRIAESRVEARSWTASEDAFSRALTQAGGTPEWAFVARLWETRGRALRSRNEAAKARAAFAEALRIRTDHAPESLTLAALLNNTANDLPDLEATERAHKKALAIREREAPDSLALAASLNNLGTLAERRNDLAAAEGYHNRARAIRERVDPDGPQLADSLNNLGNLAWYRGDLDRAEELHRRAYEIRSKLRLDLGASLLNLGAIAWARGQLRSAEDRFRQFIDLLERTAPENVEMALGLNNLGLVLSARGYVDEAEDFFQRAFDLHEKAEPGSAEAGAPLHNLGDTAHLRKDLDRAESYYRRALEVRRRAPGETVDISGTLSSLALVLQEKGRLAEAEEVSRQAMASLEKLAPGSTNLAAVLDHHADILRARGDLAGAEDLRKRALAIYERLAPGSLMCAETWGGLALIKRAQGQPAEAEALLGKALPIFSSLAPGSTGEATAFHELGRLARDAGDMAKAVALFERALDALESQTARIGGSDESRSGYSASEIDNYRDAMAAQIASGDTRKAFQTLERSRARSLLTMLAERDLVFPSEIPPELDQQQRATDAEYDRVLAELARPDDADPAAQERRTARLRELRENRSALRRQLRAASPRLAALKYPEPLDLARVRSALDPGTLLLAYAVLEDETLLFAVPADGAIGPEISVYELPVRAQELRRRVGGFRKAIGDVAPARDVDRDAEALFTLLLGPARELIARSQRLLISPDGPLHSLPFAALAVSGRTVGKARRATYLVEWKPIHTTVSATVYAELQKRRPAGPEAGGRLVAFADPSYAADPGPSPRRDASVRAAGERGYDLGALRFARSEVSAITRLYPTRSVAYVGAEASERRAKSLPPDVRYLHFACHGLLDEWLPLNSALALSATDEAGGDNGLLQAWEIFESVRLHADLVTLSACQTALGKETEGEGLVGLTRAFQYAGARSVLASLWSVSDRSTARLMERFYSHLKAGLRKDEALRRAQLDLIRAKPGSDGAGETRGIGGLSATIGAKPDATHPFHWAGFELFGDWR